MFNLLKRTLVPKIVEDLTQKMVFIGGPRQVGKTTVSRELIAQNYFDSYSYLTWDSKQDRNKILEESISNNTLIILDEIHKFPKWKNVIKGLYDTRKKTQKFLITGSARLNTYRKSGDSLLGRYHYYRLHPLSYSELHQHAPIITPNKALNFTPLNTTIYLDQLLQYGGFPEPFIIQDERELRRWQKERHQQLFTEDIRDISNIKNLNSMKLLADMLPNKVASTLSINAIREDLEVSHKAVSLWLDIFQELYVTYSLPPYINNAIRALKKDQKLYLWDWSEIKSEGAKFENLIASHLLKTVHYLEDYHGYNAKLHYIKDKDGREVDFLVTIDNMPWFSVEAKLTKTDIPTPLKYFNKKLNIPYNYVVTRDEINSYSKDNITVLSASTFLSGLM